MQRLSRVFCKSPEFHILWVIYNCLNVPKNKRYRLEFHQVQQQHLLDRVDLLVLNALQPSPVTDHLTLKMSNTHTRLKAPFRFAEADKIKHREDLLRGRKEGKTPLVSVTFPKQMAGQCSPRSIHFQFFRYRTWVFLLHSAIRLLPIHTWGPFQFRFFGSSRSIIS